MLGDLQQEKVFRFRRSKDGKIVVPLEHWKWAVEEAVDGLRLALVDQECFHSAVAFEAPTVILYGRSYTLHGQKKSVNHEAMRKGTELTFNMLVTKRPPIRSDRPQTNKFPPDKRELEQVLKYIGKYIGISPFGSHMDYGRYQLLGMEEIVPEL